MPIIANPFLIAAVRELTDIVHAFRSLCGEGKPSALATVIAVEGSAYRRPGARMLVAEDGRTWGGVSGGCLERDVADRARGIIASGRSFVCRYDSADDELISRGVSTGCGGTIDVLIQPIDADHPGPLRAMTATLADGRSRDVFTFARTGGAWGRWTGLTVDSDKADPTPPVELVEAVARHRVAASANAFRVGSAEAWADVFVSRIVPPQRLVLVGGGPDVVPIVAIAKTLGWRVAVVAAPPAATLFDRFAAADERYVTPTDAPLSGVPILDDDAVVVMTHNLIRDTAVLDALPIRPRFLGVLGPSHRSDRLVDGLPATHPARTLRSPVGLDLGARTPEEIALSIVAGVQAALRDATGTPLAGGNASSDASVGRKNAVASRTPASETGPA